MLARGRLAIAEYTRSRGKNAAALEKFFEDNKSSDAAVESARMLLLNDQLRVGESYRDAVETTQDPEFVRGLRMLGYLGEEVRKCSGCDRC